MQALSNQASIDFMFGALLWNEQRGWQQLLFVGQTFDDPSELQELSRQGELNRADTPQWQPDGRPGHPLIRLFEEQNTGALRHRPWSDHLWEPHAAAELLSSVLSEPAVAPRAGTNGVVIGIAAERPKLVDDSPLAKALPYLVTASSVRQSWSSPLSVELHVRVGWFRVPSV